MDTAKQARANSVRGRIGAAGIAVATAVGIIAIGHPATASAQKGCHSTDESYINGNWVCIPNAGIYCIICTAE